LQCVNKEKENWFTNILFSTLKHEIDLNVEELSPYFTENMMSVTRITHCYLGILLYVTIT